MPQTQSRRPGIGEQISRSLPSVEFRAVEGQERTFELSFSSETPVARWWGNEILSHDEAAPRLDRINDGGCLLYGHKTDINSVLGPVVKAWLDSEQRKCRAIVRFDDDEDVEKVFKRVQSGTLKNVSVRYSIDAYEEVRPGATSSNGRHTGPCDVITAWTVYEISITPVPADNAVGVGRSEEGPHPSPPHIGEGAGEDSRAAAAAQNNANRQEANMPKKIENGQPVEERQAPAAGAEPVTQPAAEPRGAAPTGGSNVQPAGQSAEEIRAAAVTAERERSTAITTLCRELGIGDAERDAFISEGRTLDQVREAAIEILKERNKPAAGIRVEVTHEQADTFREAGPHAMLLRAGYTSEQLRNAGIEKPHEAAGSLRHMTLRGLMEEDLRLRGRMDASRMDTLQLMREVLTPDSAFLSIVNTTVNASMLIGHAAAATTFQYWTKPGSLPNLKETKGFRLSEAGAPQLVKQNGEFEFDEMSDEGISRKLNTYAIGWGLTEDAILNDDLDVITQMPMAYTVASKREINHDVYDLINSNPVIYDGHELFDSANHGNVGTGAAPTVLALSEGRKLMLAQKGIRGLQALNIQPAFLIAGSDVQTPAEQLVSALNDPAATTPGVPNPAFVRKLTVISDGEITDTNSWVLAADPNVTDTIGVEYLNGQQEPRIESQIAFQILGVAFRLVMRYGITVKDYRGLVLNAGAS